MTKTGSPSSLPVAAPLPADAETAVAPAAPPARPTLRAWLRDHDEQWPFVVLYLSASVLLSILISLFWLVVVIAVHYAFEWVRQSHYRVGRRDIGLHALWEVKLDIGLAALAFALALYVDVILGVLGLQSAARVATAARVVPRVAAWERNLRTFLLTVDEMARVSHAAYKLKFSRRRRGTASDEPAGPFTPEAQSAVVAAWRSPWGWADRIGVALVSVGVGLILLAPLLTPHDLASSVSMILEQLRPFPAP
jgi:hypothetical protein